MQMMYLRAVTMCMLAIACAAELAMDKKPLGTGFYIPDEDLAGEITFNSQIIFEKFDSSCFLSQVLSKGENTVQYYESTEEFYKSVGASVGLRLKSVFTLGVTLYAAANDKESNNSFVRGASFVIYEPGRRLYLDKKCIVKSPLSADLIRDFKNLPSTVDNPEKRTSWGLYDAFLKKFGSHFVKSADTGSLLTTYVFAKNTTSYSKRNFTVKACLGVKNAPTEVGLFGVSACAQITKEDVESAASFEMSSKVTIMGGKGSTRTKLYTERTDELIEKFRNEARTTELYVKYKLMSIFDLLQQRYVGTTEYNKLVNMEQYFFGFLNYGCSLTHVNNTVTSKFVQAPTYGSGIPNYLCKISGRGCTYDSDCHGNGRLWCGCTGETCFDHKIEILADGTTKKIAVSHYGIEWGGPPGCHINLRNLHCYCNKSFQSHFYTTWNGEELDSHLMHLGALHSREAQYPQELVQHGDEL